MKRCSTPLVIREMQLTYVPELQGFATSGALFKEGEVVVTKFNLRDSKSRRQDLHQSSASPEGGLAPAHYTVGQLRADFFFVVGSFHAWSSLQLVLFPAAATKYCAVF